ncbi:MAG: hypothetical protein OEV79_12210 [candidate division WOR-3 bacterium]|nr:hypothetical protein [candidate division WOR-3 bacterium]
MRRTVAVVLLIILVLNCAPVLPQYERPMYDRKHALVISERIGETIDPEERRQFDLFHGIEAFKEARFFALANGGYVLEITTDDEKLVSVNRHQDAIIVLRDYINKYEEINADRAAFTRRWRVLEYDTLGIPITESEVRQLVERSRRYAVIGCLACCAVPTGLGLWAAFDANRSEDNGIGAAIEGTMGLLAGYAAVLVGVTSGVVVYFMTYKNAKSCIQAIKELRKPRPVE